MKITSWNVNGIRAITKKNFLKDISKINPDILCLQETKADEKITLEYTKSLTFNYKYAYAAEKKGYSGTALFSKPKPENIKFGINTEEHDNEGRVITAEYKDFLLVNVYTPNAGQGLKRLAYKQKWNTDFITYILKLEQRKPVIICGDLNVAHKPIDLKNPKPNYNKTAGYTQIEINAMEELLNAGFIDVFRYFYPEEIKYTYWSYRFNARAKNTGWRIDYFIISNKIIGKVKDITLHNEIYGSDHCPISLIIT